MTQGAHFPPALICSGFFHTVASRGIASSSMKGAAAGLRWLVRATCEGSVGVEYAAKIPGGRGSLPGVKERGSTRVQTLVDQYSFF